MATTGTITLRNLPQTCWPPSVRHTFADEAAALADAPNTGEVYEIDGVLYYFDGTDFQPLVPPGDHVEVPASAFADPDSPTQTEVDTWVTANHPDARHHTTFYYIGDGTVDMPDYAWGKDTLDGVVREIQDISVITKPIAIIDVVRVDPSITTSGENSFANAFGETIDTYNWVVTNLNSGAEVANITGVAGADASGEALVNSGSYSNPLWAIDDTCTPYRFALTVTDTAGNVSETVSVDVNKGGTEVTLVFNHNAAVDPNFNLELGFSDDYVASTDLGDGTIIDGSSVSHTYGATGNYVVRSTVCAESLLSVDASSNALSGQIQQIFAGDISQFVNLQEYDFSDNSLSGSVPDMSLTPTIVNARADNNLLTGNAPSVVGATSIEVYSFHNNQMSGELPYIAGSTGISVFDLGENNMSGQWHDITGNNSLVLYDISENGGITGATTDFGNGEARAQLLNKVALEYFDISGNMLTGRPFQLSGVFLPVIDYFDIADNNFDGVLGLNEWLIAGTAVTHIDYSNNQIIGSFPSLAPLVNLEYLDLSNNLLSGEPRPTTTNTLLQYLDFSNNALTTASFALDRTLNTALAFLHGNDNVASEYISGEIGAGNAALLDIDYSGTPFTPGSLDLLCDVDGLGTNGGTLGVPAGMNPPVDPTALACHTALVGRGWTIFT